MAVIPPIAGFLVKLALDRIRRSTQEATSTPFPRDPSAPGPTAAPVASPLRDPELTSA